MIPLQLALSSFLSYHQATLNFQGLHVACVCGANGAGKSSLLEAIAWVVWGHSRVATEDDVIHMGALEAKVDFAFTHQQQTYRIIRSRHRTQGTMLEFQLRTDQGWRVLTQRGVRATQQLILQHLRLDYDTFVNSAYLRQGRADEFMLKRPAERKQILADLLKLDRYDHLAERAKEEVRQARAELGVLERTMATQVEQLAQRGAIAQDYHALQASLEGMQQQSLATSQRLDGLKLGQHQRQGKLDQQQTQSQQLETWQQTCEQLTQEFAALQTQHASLVDLLAQEDQIMAGYGQLLELRSQDQQQTDQLQRVQSLQQQRAELYQQYQAQTQQIRGQLRDAEHALANLQGQIAEQEQILSQADVIESAVTHLRQSQAQLRELDRRQLAASPLLQRRQALVTEIDRVQARLAARLESLISTQAQLQGQQSCQPQLRQAVTDGQQMLAHLEARRAYQEQVREKGLERRSFMERLQANHRTYEIQLAQLDQKLRLLSEPNAVCPVCDRALDEQHWHLVLERHRLQQDEAQTQIWVIREQLAVSEREIQVLRQEYRELEAELTHYAEILQRQGHLQAQLDSTADVQQRLQALEEERAHLERCLQEQHYAVDLQTELQQLEAELQRVQYDDRDHALVRGQVDRLRWAESKAAELQQAQRKLGKLTAQRPELEDAIAQLTSQLADLERSPLHQALTDLDQQLAEIGYHTEHHNALRTALRQAEPWQIHYQALRQAQQQLPQVQHRWDEAAQHLQACHQTLTGLKAAIAHTQADLEDLPDVRAEIAELEQVLQQQQAWRDRNLATLGGLQQQLQQLDQVQALLDASQQTRQALQNRIRVYQELATAFGRNGIQALMIENILPQLETETNQILGRLSAHQLHVQFVTQRSGRSRSSRLIETLDILIADAQGTRPYETYSGGEAFRVNFAIRLALARLLAQRSGTALQLLIVDEGFGTQDADGCERLIAAINAIAPDFACILAVTHIPHFRDAFQTRIDVVKTAEGSQINLVS